MPSLVCFTAGPLDGFIARGGGSTAATLTDHSANPNGCVEVGCGRG